ncbi:MAG: hypothetical protein VYB44_07070 [Bacteroidota bacterium]|nr:hypothetical protein [Bacteroidota bacterium]
MGSIKGYIQDVNVPATFTLERDCVDEIIYIDVYIIGTGKLANSPINVILPTIAVPNPPGLVKGATKGTKVSVPVNYSLIGAPGGNYSFVARTVETGVVFSSSLLILAEDGFTAEGYQGNTIDPSVGTILKTDGDGTKFLNDQGQYVEVNAVAISDEDFWVNNESYPINVAKLYTYNNITSWYISVVGNNEGNTPRILSGANAGEVNTDYWKLVSADTSQNLIKYATDSIFKAVTTVVIKDSKLYELISETRPYLSTDFDAELTAGDWQLIGGSTMSNTEIRDSLANLAGTERLGSNSIKEDSNRSFITDSERNKLASIDATHYLPPIQTTIQLTALTEASLSDKARVYVEDEISDFFYDAHAVSGDYAPDDQTGGTGFWKKVAVDGETAASIKTKYESNPNTNAFTDVFYNILNTFSTSVLGVSLTGLSITNAAITAADTILSAFGKVQGQINYIIQSLSTKVPVSTPVVLTDSTNISVDCSGEDNKLFVLSANNTTFSLALQNLADGRTCQFIITPQSTATYNITLSHAGLTMLVANAAGATWELAAETGKRYRLFVTTVGSVGICSFDERKY